MFQIVPISESIDEFARQKAILKRKGQLIEDSDLWIGVTAIAHDLIMVTENVNHLSRIEGITIENWIKRFMFCSQAHFFARRGAESAEVWEFNN